MINQNNIKEIQIASGYAGSEPKINVYTKEGDRHILTMEEAKQILLNALNAGNETTLEPRQQYKRIHIKVSQCSQEGCKKETFKPYCWCFEHHNERANT